MNTKHTPAPWNKDLEAIKDVMGRFRIQVYRKGLECIAVISGKNKKELEANAKLIAAAPELLEALQDLLKQIKYMGHDSTVGYLHTNKAYEILKKATE